MTRLDPDVPNCPRCGEPRAATWPYCSVRCLRLDEIERQFRGSGFQTMTETQSKPQEHVKAGYDFEESLWHGGLSCECGWDLETEDMEYEWAASAYDLHLINKHDRRLVVPKDCPNCDVRVWQTPDHQAWHWCDDGEKYELTIEHRHNPGEKPVREHYVRIEAPNVAARKFLQLYREEESGARTEAKRQRCGGIVNRIERQLQPDGFDENQRERLP